MRVAKEKVQHLEEELAELDHTANLDGDDSESAAVLPHANVDKEMAQAREMRTNLNGLKLAVTTRQAQVHHTSEEAAASSAHSGVLWQLFQHLKAPPQEYVSQFSKSSEDDDTADLSPESSFGSWISDARELEILETIRKHVFDDLKESREDVERAVQNHQSIEGQVTNLKKKAANVLKNADELEQTLCDDNVVLDLKAERTKNNHLREALARVRQEVASQRRVTRDVKAKSDTALQSMMHWEASVAEFEDFLNDASREFEVESIDGSADHVRHMWVSEAACQPSRLNESWPNVKSRATITAGCAPPNGLLSLPESRDRELGLPTTASSPGSRFGSKDICRVRSTSKSPTRKTLKKCPIKEFSGNSLRVTSRSLLPTCRYLAPTCKTPAGANASDLPLASLHEWRSKRAASKARVKTAPFLCARLLWPIQCSKAVAVEAASVSTCTTDNVEADKEQSQINDRRAFELSHFQKSDEVLWEDLRNLDEMLGSTIASPAARPHAVPFDTLWHSPSPASGGVTGECLLESMVSALSCSPEAVE